eukprot:4753_1
MSSAQATAINKKEMNERVLKPSVYLKIRKMKIKLTKKRKSNKPKQTVPIQPLVVPITPSNVSKSNVRNSMDICEYEREHTRTHSTIESLCDALVKNMRIDSKAYIIDSPKPNYTPSSGIITPFQYDITPYSP